MIDITRDKEEHFIKVKGQIHEEVTTVLNVYMSNNRGSHYLKQKHIEMIKLEEEQKNKFTIMVGDFNSLLSGVNR